MGFWDAVTDTARGAWNGLTGQSDEGNKAAVSATRPWDTQYIDSARASGGSAAYSSLLAEDAMRRRAQGVDPLVSDRRYQQSLADARANVASGVASTRGGPLQQQLAQRQAGQLMAQQQSRMAYDRAIAATQEQMALEQAWAQSAGNRQGLWQQQQQLENQQQQGMSGNAVNAAAVQLPYYGQQAGRVQGFWGNLLDSGSTGAGQGMYGGGRG